MSGNDGNDNLFSTVVTEPEVKKQLEELKENHPCFTKRDEKNKISQDIKDWYKGELETERKDGKLKYGKVASYEFIVSNFSGG